MHGSALDAPGVAASDPAAAVPRPLRAVWRTYAVWACAAGVAFFTVYPTCNWWTSQRTYRLPLYLPAELHVPFVPELVWVYVSMYALFLAPPLWLSVAALRALGRRLVAGTLAAGAIFLLLPTELGFERTLPTDPLYAAIFRGIFSLDLPHNMVPSLHVLWSALILLAVADDISRNVWRVACWLWLTAICASTLLVHQHHLADVIASLLIVWGLRSLIPSPARSSAPQADRQNERCSLSSQPPMAASGRSPAQSLT